MEPVTVVGVRVCVCVGEVISWLTIVRLWRCTRTQNHCERSQARKAVCGDRETFKYTIMMVKRIECKK